MNKIEEITAYIDNEIFDQSIIGRIKRMIEEDPESRAEYFQQTRIKNLLMTRFSKNEAPAYLVNNIRNEISKQFSTTRENKLIRIFKETVSNKYSFAFAVILTFIIIVSYPFIPSSGDEPIPIIQPDKSHFISLVHSSFHQIIEGKLEIQFSDSDAESIRKFYEINGIDYISAIPKCPEWKIKGAIISESGNEKFAHTIFTNKQGEVLDLFQVKENYLNSEIMNDESVLSHKELIQGKVFRVKNSDCEILIMKHKNNLMAIASNSQTTNLQDSFLSYLN